MNKGCLIVSQGFSGLKSRDLSACALTIIRPRTMRLYKQLGMSGAPRSIYFIQSAATGSNLDPCRRVLLRSSKSREIRLRFSGYL